MIKRVLIGAAATILGLALNVAATAGEQQLPNAVYSVAGLYDRGNAAARIGNPAEAVLNYERARVLAPMDPDIRANLQHVRAAAGLPQLGGFTQHDRFANPDLMYWLGILGIVLVGASLLLRRFGGMHGAAITSTAIIGLVLTALSLEDAFATAPTLHAAVVMRASPANASPVSSGAEPLFTIPQADVVSMEDEHQEFVLVRDSQSREGWIARSNLTPIIPREARR